MQVVQATNVCMSAESAAHVVKTRRSTHALAIDINSLLRYPAHSQPIDTDLAVLLPGRQSLRIGKKLHELSPKHLRRIWLDQQTSLTVLEKFGDAVHARTQNGQAGLARFADRQGGRIGQRREDKHVGGFQIRPQDGRLTTENDIPGWFGCGQSFVLRFVGAATENI
jgi:hypothetical protein